ncbi:hypothetical protein AAZX31_20G078600, partial [Glycine max]
MSQLGYMMLALGMGSYRAALFHLITHAYSKALLFLGSGSIIHSMEALVGYSPAKSQNMVLMGGLTKHVPITKTSFLVGTLSLCGIPPFACFWYKDEILNDSWLYSPICACGNYRVIRDKKDDPKFCEQCGVEFIDSRIRRYQMGYIKLACLV